MNDVLAKHVASEWLTNARSQSHLRRSARSTAMSESGVQGWG